MGDTQPPNANTRLKILTLFVCGEDIHRSGTVHPGKQVIKMLVTLVNLQNVLLLCFVCAHISEKLAFAQQLLFDYLRSPPEELMSCFLY